MTALSPSLILVAAATFFVGGVVKGVTGMGLPTVAMAILGGLVSPVTAAGLMIAPAFVTNVWQIFTRRSLGRLLARLWTMMAAVVAGTIGGASLMTGGDVRMTTSALGAPMPVSR